ncbi:MAG: hypothetical protein Q8O89_00275 [Nanoarchaeota archaeon]|nr:hypothetical protein [Nanoarchaeota archaeon]
MTSVTLAVTDKFKEELKHFVWVNWSEIAREETMKKLIFQKYLETGNVSDDDWAFCDKIDWHPVDELPLKKEYAQKLKKAKKEKAIKINSISSIFK